MMEESDWDRIFAVNVKGIYNCVNAAMGAFLSTHKGSIITVSSMWGQVGASCEAAYSATKGAVIALTKALAQELGPSGIRVNAVAPGYIGTDMTNALSDKVKETMKAQIPAKRIGTPEDVANVVAFLCSDEAAYVTGEVIRVDGGLAI